jgi:hypothetical protein
MTINYEKSTTNNQSSTTTEPPTTINQSIYQKCVNQSIKNATHHVKQTNKQ